MADARVQDALVLTERRGEILVITLNNPSKLNALSRAMAFELSGAWEQAEESEVRAVVLTGAGRGFCAGADLVAGPEDVAEHPLPPLRYSYGPMILKISSLAKPVVAAVNGPAAGAGLGLACAADLRLASTNATFIPAFAKIGSIPDMGTSYHLPRLLGYPRALQWMLTGRHLGADEALEAGLVQAVVEPEELLDLAESLCASLLVGTNSSVGLTKLLLRDSWSNSLAEQLEQETRFQATAAADPNKAAARGRVTDSLSSTR